AGVRRRSRAVHTPRRSGEAGAAIDAGGRSRDRPPRETARWPSAGHRAGGRRVDRQATLRAVFDWSWDLLSLPEKAALAQLSVFEGGFTLAAVEAILELSAYDNAPW